MLGKYHDINFLSISAPISVSQSFTAPIFLLQLFFAEKKAQGKEDTTRDYGAH
jgi:hypothetical protein